MKPDPAPRTGSACRCWPPPGAGMPKRLKKSLSGSSPCPPPSGSFSITSMLTTAGPYLATSGEKSGREAVPPGAHCTAEAAVAAYATCAPIAGQPASTRRARDIIAARARPRIRTLMSDSGMEGSSTRHAQAPPQDRCPESADQSEGGEAHDQPISNTRIRREPGPGRDGRPQCIGLEGWCRCLDLAAWANDRGEAVVGGYDHVAALLERAHAGHLELLVAGRAVSEPAIVGDVHEHIRLREHAQHIGSVSYLVADGGPELQSSHRQRRLVRAAAIEALIRQAHQAQPVTHEMRYRKELRERHQVVLGIPARRVAERQDRIVIVMAVIRGAQHAHDERRPAILRLAVDERNVRQQIVGQIR